MEVGVEYPALRTPCRIFSDRPRALNVIINELRSKEYHASKPALSRRVAEDVLTGGSAKR